MAKTNSFPQRPEGPAISGEWRGPRWLPHLRDHKDPDATAKSAEFGANPDSRAIGPIAGKVVTVDAWGRGHYALAVDDALYLLPEHVRLWTALGRVKIGAEVWIDLQADRIKKSFVYDVVPFSQSDALTASRPDALKPSSTND